MLLANNADFTLERTPEGELALTILATGETITLTASTIYALGDFIMDALESLEFEADESAQKS